MRGVEQTEHRITHRADDVGVGTDPGGKQCGVLGQTATHELLDEVDAHATGQKEEHRLRTAGTDLRQLSRIIELSELGIELINNATLVERFEPRHRIFARLVIGRDHEYAFIVALGGKQTRRTIIQVVLPRGREEQPVALLTSELSRPGVRTDIHRVGLEGFRRYREQDVGEHDAGEHVDMITLEHAFGDLHAGLGA